MDILTRKKNLILLTFITLFLSINIYAQLPAFPEAEGYGKYSAGGRNGKVYEVTNLNDKGPGSLREVVTKSGARIIVFRVSGTISLNSRLTITKDSIYIAGQTAPGDGICIKKFPLVISANNVIIRYIRCRLGDEDPSGNDDAMAITHGTHDIIIDHCSVSWSIDECLSFYGESNTTVQWNIISESLSLNHHVKGAHGFGGIWGGNNVTLHHNLFAHHTSRNPRFAGGVTDVCSNVDYRNNVIYNWGYNSAYGGEAGTINMVGNYYKPGPATKPNVRNRILDVWDTKSRWYVEDNYVEGYPDISADNWSGGVQGKWNASSRVTIPFPFVPIKMHSPKTLFNKVMSYAGCILPKRDVIDTRIINETRTGNATYYSKSYSESNDIADGIITGIIDSQSTVGGYPELHSSSPPMDIDHDGMPDDWELSHSLNPNNPEDRNHTASDGYTYIETYLNELGAFEINYTNPIIYADYSDPDVIRTGNDYYMTSSSFSNFPGLPILHSTDLVNWKIISYAVENYPIDSFNVPQHGNGIWAPSIRYHNNEYYIYFGDPDNGIFMTKAIDPKGPWSPLHLVRKAKGWIDPCPIWDDNSDAYLVHAWAKSRSGIKSILTLNKMSPDGMNLLDEGVTIFDGTKNHPTIEGPKFYKRNGYYYIFAPAGGVKPGWQTVLRSKNIYGPYEDKVVLEQGSTDINGPHQGAWIETLKGESWFIHFQDKDAYGRIVHLQPVTWKDDWPLIGVDKDNNGIGEPVNEFRRPDSLRTPIHELQASDDFDSDTLSLQWQWPCNYSPDWISLTANKGYLRFYYQYCGQDVNLYNCPYVLTQKIPAEEFIADVKLKLSTLSAMEKAGVIIYGTDYSYIALQKSDSAISVITAQCLNADQNMSEGIVSREVVNTPEITFRVKMEKGGVCNFYYSMNGKQFTKTGKEFTAKAGKWVGAKIGLFSTGSVQGRSGYTDFDCITFHLFPRSSHVRSELQPHCND